MAGDYEGPDRRAVQYVTVEGFGKQLWVMAVAIVGMIFAMGSFYGHTLATETEIRAALAATAVDQQDMTEGILSISETMGSVVAEQVALRRDVERLRDEVER